MQGALAPLHVMLLTFFQNTNKSLCGLHAHKHGNMFLIYDCHAFYFLLVGVGLFTPLPAALGGAGLGAEGAGLAAGWVLG